MTSRARRVALVGVYIALAAVVLAAQETPPPTEPQTTAPPAAPDAAPPAPTAEQYSRKGADTCLVCHDDAKMLSIF